MQIAMAESAFRGSRKNWRERKNLLSNKLRQLEHC